MTFTVEVEQDGSLTLSQEVVRETLGLPPGAKVNVEPDSDGVAINLRPAESESEEGTSSRLYWKNGWLVYDGPSDPPFDSVSAVHEMRDERIEHLAQRASMVPKS